MDTFAAYENVVQGFPSEDFAGNHFAPRTAYVEIESALSHLATFLSHRIHSFAHYWGPHYT